MGQKALSDSEASWLYTRPTFGRHGRSLAENNFKKERRDWLAVLLREVLQNGLDARADLSQPVRVRLSRVSVDEAFCEALLPQEHLDRLKRSLPHRQDDVIRPDSFLVIEDFGTTGLTGTTDNPERDGTGENWNAFWFREGEGGKELSSGNGGAGQGKITYFSTSSVRTVFAFTVRLDDKQAAIFGASSFLRDYDFGEHKCLRDAYWGLHIERDDQVLMAVPSSAQVEIQRFRQELGLTRTLSQPGLSLIIPGAKQFNDSEAIEVVSAEFFAPILRGDLSVDIGTTLIDKTNVIELANRYLTDERARELHTCMTAGFRDFYAEALRASANHDVVEIPTVTAASDLTESHLDAEMLENLRKRFENGERVSVRLSLPVKPRTGPVVTCTFDVHIRDVDDIDFPEQAVLRRDLLIGEEPIGGGKIRQRVRAVTIIPDSPLSRLLLCAEEPTHLRWNTRLPRLEEYFKGGALAVALVRNAGAKFLDILTSGEQKREFKLLAKYFSAPGSSSSSATKGKKNPKGRTIPVPPVLPPAPATLLNLSPLIDGCRINPTTAMAEGKGELPIDVVVDFAYEGLDRDAFLEYDPLDFDLSEANFRIEATGCTVKPPVLNRLEAQIHDRNFALTVRGFDQNLRLRMRLNYTEERDATDVETE